MIDDVSDIKAMYDNGVDYEHDRLERHQLEYDITWRFLSNYLPPDGHLLEIGAATGRYTVELAKRGYKVTAVDLSQNLLEKCRERLEERGIRNQVELIVADARDLSKVGNNVFDSVLIMGPLYHLVEEDDRIAALKEVYRHLRVDVLVFSAFISRLGMLGDVMKKIPEWIENQDEVRSILEHGRDPQLLRGLGFRGYFAEVSEIAPLHENVGFRTMAIAGVEPCISADDESYNCLQEKRRELWLDLLFEASTRDSIIGASRHLLYIGKK